LHIKVNLPIIIKTDNIGAIFMAENLSTGVRTRHVDTRYHFIREFIEDSFIKVEFFRSVENDANIFSKNVSHDLYVKHTKNFCLTQEILVWVDLFGIGRVLEISFKSNLLVLFV
jgi:hypothetical protein